MVKCGKCDKEVPLTDAHSLLEDTGFKITRTCQVCWDKEHPKIVERLTQNRFIKNK